MRLDDHELGALDHLQQALDGGGDTIDDVLKLAHAGFGARPFAELARLYAGDLAAWQAEELAEHLADLLDTVDEWLAEGARAHMDPAIPGAIAPLLATLRSLESRLDEVTNA
jgi:hypothetical protein